MLQITQFTFQNQLSLRKKQAEPATETHFNHLFPLTNPQLVIQEYAVVFAEELFSLVEMAQVNVLHDHYSQNHIYRHKSDCIHKLLYQCIRTVN